MITTKRLLPLAFTALYVLTACSDVEIPENCNQPSFKESVSNFISPAEAAELANTFASDYSEAINNDSDSRAAIPVRVANANNVSDLFSPSSRDDISQVYVVNYNDEQGFALIAKKRDIQSPVIAFIEKGHYNEEMATKNKGFKIFADCAQHKLASSPGHTIGGSFNIDSVPHTVVINPTPQMMAPDHLVEVAWGQGGIFGKYCPNGIAGCVNTAIAQIFAYYKRPTTIQITYDGSNKTMTLDWDKIETHRSTKKYLTLTGWEKQEELCTDDTHHQISTLLRQLGHDLHSYYGDSNGTSTSVSTSNLYQTLYTKYGMKTTFRFIPYSEVELRLAIINAKRPMLMYGELEYDSHVWVCDGQWLKPESEDVSNQYFYYNWGYDGMFNGYFLAGVFQETKDSEPYSNIEIMKVDYR